MLSTAKKACTCKQKGNVDKNKRLVEEYLAKYNLNDNELKNFQDLFLTEMKRGLAKATHENADIKCFITYVVDLPDGSERGNFLALDLGGSTFRILLIDLKGDRTCEIKSKIYTIDAELMTDVGEKLFDHIADCISNFVVENKLQDIGLPLGFTFSFPVKQLSIHNAILIRWTKGFNCAGVIGKNVVDLLKQSIIKKKAANITSIALINDATGTILSCALENPNCKIGLIIGTGFNCCYCEKISEVENWDSSIPDATHVIINTECGAFGTNGCIDFLRTDEDRHIDTNSINPNQQILEKMVCGMYMGEIVRLIMLKFIAEKLLFGGNGSDSLEVTDSFKTVYIGEIESDEPGVYVNCKRILKLLRLDKNATDEDIETILQICQCVSKRSATLTSAVIATIINKIGDKNITIGIDGSVYRLHPQYKNVIMQKIKDLVNPGLNFSLMLSEDGAGKGAAITAATCDRKK